ncbi:MAG: hypothetical protein ABIA04_02415 [Pseudomonadota bacterium]
MKLNKKHKKIILDILKIIFAYRKGIALIILLCLLYGLYEILKYRPNYTSNATIIPTVEKTNIANTSTSGPLDHFLNSTTSRNRYFNAIISSRTLAERVVNKLDLLPILFEKQWDEDEKKWKKGFFFDNEAPTITEGALMLSGHISTWGNKDSFQFWQQSQSEIISFSVQFKYQDLCVKILKTYLEELKGYLIEIKSKNLKDKVTSLETRMIRITSNIEQLNNKLMIFAEGRGSLKINKSLSGLLGKASSLISQISLKQIELETIKSIELEIDNKDVVNELNSDINTLKAEYKEIAKNFLLSKNDDITVPVSKVPVLDIEYRRLELEYHIQKEILIYLQKELEVAKVELIQIASPFIIIDNPMDQGRQKRSKWNYYYTLKRYFKKGLYYAFIYICFMEFLAFRRKYMETKKN